MPALLERPKLSNAMARALHKHIMRERERKRQGAQFSAINSANLLKNIPQHLVIIICRFQYSPTNTMIIIYELLYWCMSVQGCRQLHSLKYSLWDVMKKYKLALNNIKIGNGHNFSNYFQFRAILYLDVFSACRLIFFKFFNAIKTTVYNFHKHSL